MYPPDYLMHYNCEPAMKTWPIMHLRPARQQATTTIPRFSPLNISTTQRWCKGDCFSFLCLFYLLEFLGNGRLESPTLLLATLLTTTTTSLDIVYTYEAQT